MLAGGAEWMKAHIRNIDLPRWQWSASYRGYSVGGPARLGQKRSSQKLELLAEELE